MQFLGIYWGEVLGRSGKRSVDDWGVTNNLSQVQIHNMCSAVRDGGSSDYTVICAKRSLVINAGAWMYGRSSNTAVPNNEELAADSSASTSCLDTHGVWIGGSGFV